MLGLYLRLHIDEIINIIYIDKYYLIIISLLIIVRTLISAFPNKILLEQYGINLKFLEWYPLFLITSIMNMLPMAAGFFGKGYILKKKYNLSYSDFGSISAGFQLINLSFKSFIGFIACTLLFFSDQVSMAIPITFLLITIFINTFMIFAPIFSEKIYYTKNSFYHKYFSYLMGIIKGIRPILKNYELLFSLITIMSVSVIITAFKYYLIFHSLSYNISFLQTLIITIVIHISSIIKITPSNLGIQEFTTGLISIALGGSLHQGVIVATFDRIITVFWTLLLGFIFKKYFIKNFS